MTDLQQSPELSQDAFIGRKLHQASPLCVLFEIV